MADMVLRAVSGESGGNGEHWENCRKAGSSKQQHWHCGVISGQTHHLSWQGYKMQMRPKPRSCLSATGIARNLAWHGHLLLHAIASQAFSCNWLLLIRITKESKDLCWSLRQKLVSLCALGSCLWCRRAQGMGEITVAMFPGNMLSYGDAGRNRNMHSLKGKLTS